MGVSFHNLNTTSKGESRDYRNKREKGGFVDVNPGDHKAPDAARTGLKAPAPKNLDDSLASKSPQLKPTV